MTEGEGHTPPLNGPLFALIRLLKYRDGTRVLLKRSDIDAYLTKG